MIKEYLSTIGTRIHKHDDGNLLAVVRDVIIDTDTGKIEGFWVKPLTVPLNNAVIQTSDIIEWKQKIYIKNDSVIGESEDIIRISDILARDILVIGNKVENINGEYLGDVYSLDFDSDKFVIRQIYTEKKVLGLIGHSKRVFGFNSIIEIKQSVIIVDDKVVNKEIVIQTGLLEDGAAT